MTTTLKPRAVIQFSAGPMKGMFAQVLSEPGKCLSRDMDGTVHTFEIKPDDSFVVCGTAALGPKVPEQTAAQPSPPPPLNPMELLEPLPTDVKATPMNEPKKKYSLPPDAPKKAYIATVKNATGEQTEVALNVPVGAKPTSRNGAAIMVASKQIPNVKPFTVDWRVKEEAIP